jgi:Mannose-6-phosphate isomerase
MMPNRAKRTLVDRLSLLSLEARGNGGGASFGHVVAARMHQRGPRERVDLHSDWQRIPLELIEVQVGSYLGEDDIVRFDDVYGRS